jgi:hypothetical protein
MLKGYGVTWNMGGSILRRPLPCRHHHSLRVSSVESDYEFCELCEARSRLRDALAMEHHYRRVAEVFETTLRSIATNSCCQPCQEAALVAAAALRSKPMFQGDDRSAD